MIPLRRPTAVLHCGNSLMFEQNPEADSVRDQQERHEQSRKEECGSELPRQESGVIGLEESVEDIGRTPDIEDPCRGNAGRTGQQEQRGQRKDRCNDVSPGRGMREGRRQIG